MQSTRWFACVTGVADCAGFKTTALEDFQQHANVVKLRGN